jgi:hypothetical protein
MANPEVLNKIYAKSVVKVLTVSTSADMLGDDKTGLWLEELAAPYNLMKEAGIDVTIASVKGGKIPLDPTSMQPENITKQTQAFIDSSACFPIGRGSVCCYCRMLQMLQSCKYCGLG